MSEFEPVNDEQIRKVISPDVEYALFDEILTLQETASFYFGVQVAYISEIPSLGQAESCVEAV